MFKILQAYYYWLKWIKWFKDLCNWGYGWYHAGIKYFTVVIINNTNKNLASIKKNNDFIQKANSSFRFQIDIYVNCDSTKSKTKTILNCG